MNSINPATTEVLTQLMMGGLPTGRAGFPLHCRLRYFDPLLKRAGIPEDVGALVESMSDDEVTVKLVNINPVTERTIVLQGGAYGEHQFQTVSINGESIKINRSTFKVHLSPGCGNQLKISMERYANSPTLYFPWDRDY